jgi:hypothetical protein
MSRQVRVIMHASLQKQSEHRRFLTLCRRMAQIFITVIFWYIDAHRNVCDINFGESIYQALFWYDFNSYTLIISYVE